MSTRNTPRQTIFDDYRERLTTAACEARLAGHHYNDFQVGAAGLFGNDDEYVIRKGCNIKVQGYPKCCAEHTMMAASLLEGDDTCFAICVAGLPRAEDETDVLLCCEVCVPMLEAMPSVHEETILHFVNPTTGDTRTMSFKELREIHQHSNAA